MTTAVETIIVTRDGLSRTIRTEHETVLVVDPSAPAVRVRDESSVVVNENGPTEIGDFAGEGARGLVPDPGAGDDDRVLRADGTWGAQSGGGGGAPTDAQYLVAALNGSLSAERLLGGESGVVSLDFATPGSATVGLVAGGTSNAKLASMAQATLKGRAAGAGTGDPTDLSASQARTLLNVEDGAAADQVASEVPFAPTGAVSATDVQAAIAELDTEKASTGALASGLAGKADLVHGHAISDVTGLQTALDGKAAISHTHATSDVTGLDSALALKLEAPVANASLANMSRGNVKGRITDSTGVPEDIPFAQLSSALSRFQTLPFETNQSFTSTTYAILLDWNDARLDAEWFTFDGATGEFTVIKNCSVDLDLRMSLVLNAAGSATFQMRVASKTGPGTYALLNDYTVAQLVNDTASAANCTGRFVWDASAGDVFVLQGRRPSGAAQIDTKLAWCWLTLGAFLR